MGGEGWGQQGQMRTPVNLEQAQYVEPPSECGMLAQRLKQLAQQRSELDQDVSSVVAQLINHITVQHDTHQSLSSRMHQELLQERSRLDASQQLVTELRASCNQYEKRLLAHEATAQEVVRLRDTLNSTRQQLTGAQQEAAGARQAQADAQQRLRQLEQELTRLQGARSVANEQIAQLQQEAHGWKELFLSTQNSAPQVPVFGSHLPLPGSMMINGPRGMPGGDGGPGAEGGMRLPPPPPPGMHPLPPLPPHGMPLPPGMWMHGPGPNSLLWAPPPGVVHTPLPPPQQPQLPASSPAVAQAESAPQHPDTMHAHAPLKRPVGPPPGVSPNPAAPEIPQATARPVSRGRPVAPEAVPNGPATLVSQPSHTSSTSLTPHSMDPIATTPQEIVADSAAGTGGAHSGQHLLGLFQSTGKSGETLAQTKPAARSNPPARQQQATGGGQAQQQLPVGGAPTPSAPAANTGSKPAAGSGNPPPRRQRNRNGSGGGRAGSDASGDVPLGLSTNSDQNGPKPAVPRPAPTTAQVGAATKEAPLGVLDAPDAKQASDTRQAGSKVSQQGGRSWYAKPNPKGAPSGKQA